MLNTEGMAEADLDSMDIDTECTSSEARMSIPAREGSIVESSGETNRDEEAESSPEEGVESSQGEDRRDASPEPEGDDWVMVEIDKPAAPACDIWLVSTSAGGEGVVGEQEGGVSDSSSQGGVSDSTEGEVAGTDSTEGVALVSDSSEDAGGEGVTNTEAAAGSSDNMEQGEVVDSEVGQDKSNTCFSSDQGERLSVGRGEEETNSEAEPAEEREEMVGGEGVTNSPVNVQSSEERNEMDR